MAFISLLFFTIKEKLVRDLFMEDRTYFTIVITRSRYGCTVKLGYRKDYILSVNNKICT